MTNDWSPRSGTGGTQDGCESGPERPRFRVSIAKTLEEVIEAWRFVYDAYRRIGVIDPNPYRLHTVPQAVSHDTGVVLGRFGPALVNTLTVCFDGPGGLALDSIYRQELDALRAEGRALAEVGLLTDRRNVHFRSTRALFELMRFASGYGLDGGATDGIIGVRPRHVSFYSRWLGFEVLGPRRNYPLVNCQPTVLLRLDWNGTVHRDSLPPGLAAITKSPVSPEAWRDRFRFEEESINNSPIAKYLQLHAAGA